MVCERTKRDEAEERGRKGYTRTPAGQAELPKGSEGEKRGRI